MFSVVSLSALSLGCRREFLYYTCTTKPMRNRLFTKINGYGCIWARHKLSHLGEKHNMMDTIQREEGRSNLSTIPDTLQLNTTLQLKQLSHFTQLYHHTSFLGQCHGSVFCGYFQPMKCLAIISLKPVTSHSARKARSSCAKACCCTLF